VAQYTVDQLVNGILDGRLVLPPSDAQAERPPMIRELRTTETDECLCRGLLVDDPHGLCSPCQMRLHQKMQAFLAQQVAGAQQPLAAVKAVVSSAERKRRAAAQHNTVFRARQEIQRLRAEQQALEREAAEARTLVLAEPLPVVNG
jgi:hypothetical protein